MAVGFGILEQLATVGRQRPILAMSVMLTAYASMHLPSTRPPISVVGMASPSAA